MAFTGVTTNAHGLSSSQQLAGLQHSVLQQQQDITRPNARLKLTLPKKPGVGGRGSYLILGSSGHMAFVFSFYYSNLGSNPTNLFPCEVIRKHTIELG